VTPLSTPIRSNVRFREPRLRLIQRIRTHSERSWAAASRHGHVLERSADRVRRKWRRHDRPAGAVPTLDPRACSTECCSEVRSRMTRRGCSSFGALHAHPREIHLGRARWLLRGQTTLHVRSVSNARRPGQRGRFALLPTAKQLVAEARTRCGSKLPFMKCARDRPRPWPFPRLHECRCRRTALVDATHREAGASRFGQGQRRPKGRRRLVPEGSDSWRSTTRVVPRRVVAGTSAEAGREPM